MNSETKTPIFLADGHPDENFLLLALERELPPEEIAQIEAHLGGCSRCRALSEEMNRGIAAFLEYRETCYLPALEQPPADFRKFKDELRTMQDARLDANASPDIWARLSRSLARVLRLPWSI